MRSNVCRILLVVGIWIVLPVGGDLRAAFERWEIGADACGMSSVGVSMLDPIFVAFINPATAYRKPGWRLSAAYSRRFNMKELGHVGYSFSRNCRTFLLSAGVERFGNDLYREEQIVLGLGFPVTAATRLGIAARFLRLHIEGYGSAWTPGFDWAWYSEPSELLRVGAVWRNVNMPRLGASGTKLPGGLIVGVSGTFRKRMTYEVEGRKTWAGEVDSGFGFAFLVSRELVLRVGYRRETGEYSFGSTLHLPLFRWDYAISAHTVLGITHYFTISTGSRLVPALSP